MIKRLSLLSLLIACHAQAEYRPEFKFSSHANFTFGSSDINEALTANHAHDPNDEFTVQGIELGAHTTWHKHIKSSVVYNAFLDEDDNLTGEWEEYYFKFVELPGNLQVKVGQMLNNTNFENSQHLHSWNFVNASLLTTRFMGDEALITQGAEVSWNFLDDTKHNSNFHVSFGDALEHGHGHGEEEGHGHGDEDDDDDDDHHDEEIEGEEALLSADVFTLGVTGTYMHDDYNHLHYRAHYTHGTNGFGRDTTAYGAGAKYVWRENGLEEGGKFFSVGAEFAIRDFDYASEDGDVTGNADETGFSLEGLYGFNKNWTAGVRYEHVEGSTEVGETPEITRVSLAGTYSFDVNEHITGHARLQYDHEQRDERDDSNTVWLQMQFNYGGAH